MVDELLYRNVDKGIHRVSRVTVSPNGLNPVVEWSIETTDSRITKPIQTFGSKEELELKFAVEGRRIGKLADSVAQLIPPTSWNDEREFPGGTMQTDWFDIEEIEEGDSK